jgi:hypothetical protein
MRTVIAAAVFGLAAAGAAAQGRVPVWSGWAEGGQGGAADCTECFENEYVLMNCARGDERVRIELIGLIPPDGFRGRAPVTLAVDGAADERDARIEHSEMFGPVPVLSVRADDPLLARMRTGRVLTLSMTGDRLDVPLTGAGEALDAMLAGCR